MLDDVSILLGLSEQRRDGPLEIIKTYTDSLNEQNLNKRIFSSQILPVAPALTFFEPATEEKTGEYKLASFFSIPDPNYTIVPFGSENPRDDKDSDLGISYNSFCGDLSLQSYTICQEAVVAPPSRGKEQSDYFKETNINNGMWSAGHLIAHRYTPPFTNNKLAATFQYKWNFIPEPYYWNCHQRNHLENRCKNGYYGIYPIYDLRYSHGRTVKPYGAGKERLPYRPIPDGEFFVGNKSNGDEVRLYMPFVTKTMGVYDSSIKENIKDKIDITVTKHKVNESACPQNITIDFTGNLQQISKRIRDKRLIDQKLALAQGNLFMDDTINPLHHAAVIQRERAATLEIKAPRNKMECALIFSSLQNQKKSKLYLKTTTEHSKFLLDKCEAEDPPEKLFSDRLLKDFKKAFPDETSCIDILNRLKPHF